MFGAFSSTFRKLKEVFLKLLNTQILFFLRIQSAFFFENSFPKNLKFEFSRTCFLITHSKKLKFVFSAMSF
jgi:hypothetical protein